MSYYSYANEKELRDEVWRKLGAPVVKVELDESHWADIVRRTKRWFLAKKSLIAVTSKDFAECGGPIPYSEIDPVNGVYKVIDVVNDEPYTYGSEGTYYEILPNGFPLWGSNGYGNGGIGLNRYNKNSYIYQVFQSIEQRRRIYGSDLDWFVQKDHIHGHMLHLSPNRSSRTYAVVYKPATLPITALEGRDQQLLFDWCLADAKETLGTIRSKYKDYPAAGGTISTDGPELLEQAKEEKERLDEEIAGSQGPMGVVFG